MNPICYLCGLEIGERPLSHDHVPPRQFFPTKFRRQNLNLETFPTHEACNKGYQNDEDYFVSTIGPLAMISNDVGRALWNDIQRNMVRPQGAILAKKISDEFSNRTEAGIILPDQMMYKYFDPLRVWRITWKIVRGLFYREHNEILPEGKPRRFGIIQPQHSNPSEIAQALVQTPSKGIHQDVFDYKYISTTKFHYWGICLWSEVVMTTLFHVLGCQCDECLKAETVTNSK